MDAGRRSVSSGGCSGIGTFPRRERHDAVVSDATSSEGALQYRCSTRPRGDPTALTSTSRFTGKTQFSRVEPMGLEPTPSAVQMLAHGFVLVSCCQGTRIDKLISLTTRL